jgi:anthranilate/para-aminobenzoate synthase component II
VLPSLAPFLAAVAATVAAEFRDRRRLVHGREMHLNKERRQAYETLSKLTKVMDFQNPQAVPEVLEAHAQVEILSETPSYSRMRTN